MSQVSAVSWCNGHIKDREEGAPSVASISFHLGTGVFDGLMAYWNEDHYYLHRPEEHLIRFQRGAARMGLEFGWSVEQILTGVERLLQLEPKGTQYIRPIAFRGAPELWVTGAEGRPVDVTIFSVHTEAHRDIDSMVTCHLSPVERISSRAIPGQTKVSGAYVNSFFARKTAETAGFDDGLMFDRDGRLAEASAANVFIIRGDGIVTPPLNPDVFPGITRGIILDLARTRGIECFVQDIGENDLRNVDGAFLCSTLMEIRGVSKIGSLPLATAELPVFKSLVNGFRALTHQ